MDLVPEDNEGMGNSGIAWDARQGRSKLLLNLLTAALNSYSVGDYGTWIRSLRSIHWVCFPYVNENKSKPVKEQLDVVDNNIRLKGFNPETMRNQMYDLMEKLMGAYKNQFMQVQEDDDKPFNADDVLGMS